MTYNKSEFLKENYTNEQVYLLAIVSASLVMDSYIEDIEDKSQIPPALAIISDVLGSIRDDLTEDELLEVASMMAAVENV
jgi:hypothetical protein